MNTENIDESLLGKFIAGEASPEEAMLVTDWIEASPENKMLFEEIESIWPINTHQKHSIASKEEVKRLLDQLKTNHHTHKQFFFTPLRVAAAILLLIVGSVAFFLLAPSKNVNENWLTSNSQSTIQTIVLNDSSSVVMNINSVLRHPSRFDSKKRSVEFLAGEAFFDIQHNPSKPFDIKVDNISIKVLGTAFNVQKFQNPPGVEVQVVRGRVMMLDENTDNHIIINAGWKGIYTSDTLSLHKLEGKNHLGYATHSFAFEDASLHEITQDLQKAFNVTLVFENEELQNCRITSTFNNRSLKFILDIIAVSLDISYQIDGDTVRISGNGCI